MKYLIKAVWTVVIIATLNVGLMFIGQQASNQEASIAACQVEDSGVALAAIQASQAAKEYSWIVFPLGILLLWGVWKPKKAKQSTYRILYEVEGIDVGPQYTDIRTDCIEKADSIAKLAVTRMWPKREVTFLHTIKK